jgi:sigma-B regulation protein RsbU (phosphoserine phosphatase)
MKACMSIMTMHTLVRMIRTQKYKDTAHFVEVINNQLCEQSIVSEEGGFITLLYGILDVERNELQWSAAGHQAPILQNLDTGEIGPVAGAEAGGLPLAVMEGADYDSYTLRIPENCRLLLYTDGLEEAFPEGSSGDAHDQFGVDGIARTMLETTEQPLEDSLARLFDASSESTPPANTPRAAAATTTPQSCTWNAAADSLNAASTLDLLIRPVQRQVASSASFRETCQEKNSTGC